jgi:hypothetical protein
VNRPGTPVLTPAEVAALRVARRLMGWPGDGGRLGPRRLADRLGTLAVMASHGAAPPGVRLGGDR